MAELEVEIDGRPARRGADVVVRSVDDIDRRVNKLERGMKRADRSMRGVERRGVSLGQVLGGVSAALITRKVIQYADSYTQLTNRLKLVTDSSAELRAVQSELFDQAAENRSGIETTAELYSRLARSSQELGLSQREVLDVTDDVSKAVKISGVSAEAANAALVQFGQGLASGALRGDELRSVLEQTPRLARALADGLGVTIGQLREMGKEGELSADRVIAAIRSQSDVLEEEFARTQPTIAEGFEQLENSAIQFIGRLNESTGASNTFASSLTGLARVLDDVGDDFFEGAFAASQFFDILISSIVTLDDRFKRFQTSAVADIAGFLGFDEFAEATQRNSDKLDAAIREEENRLQRSLDQRLENFRAYQRDLADVQQVDLTEAPEPSQTTVAPIDTKLLKEAERLYNRLRTPQQEFTDQLARIEMLREAGALTGEKYNTVIQELSVAYSNSLPEVEAYNERMEENQQIIEDLQSPTEVYQTTVARLDELLSTGQLSWEAYGRGVAQATEELQSNDPVWQAHIANMERANELLQEVETPQEAFNERLRELNRLRSSGALDDQQYARLAEAAQDAFDKATLAADPFLQKMQQIAETAGQNIEGAFTDFLVDPAEDAFDQMLNSWIETLQRMAAEALTAQIVQSLFPGGGGVGGFLAGAFGVPGAASGGTFPAGEPLIVGEEGPELIVPSQRATVVPNDQTSALMGRAAAPEVTVNPQINNIVDPQGMVSVIESGKGQSAVLNVIRLNADLIKRELSN